MKNVSTLNTQDEAPLYNTSRYIEVDFLVLPQNVVRHVSRSIIDKVAEIKPSEKLAKQIRAVEYFFTAEINTCRQAVFFYWLKKKNRELSIKS